MEKENGLWEGNRFDCLWQIVPPSKPSEYVPLRSLPPVSNYDFGVYRSTRYRNTVTNNVQADEPDPPRGGLLADSMGLGKSLDALALVAADVAAARDSQKQQLPTLVVAPTSSTVALRVWGLGLDGLTPSSTHWLARTNKAVCTQGLWAHWLCQYNSQPAPVYPCALTMVA